MRLTVNEKTINRQLQHGLYLTDNQ